MKTSKKIIAVLCTVVAVLTSATSKGQAHCTSFTITNNTNCTIIVDVLSDCNSSPSTCGTVTNYSIPGNSSYVITGCSSCSTCDYALYLLKINGAALASPFPMVSTAGPLTTTYNSGICPSVGNITASSSDIVID